MGNERDQIRTEERDDGDPNMENGLSVLLRYIPF